MDFQTTLLPKRQAIFLLNTQIDRAQHMLEDRPISVMDRNTWETSASAVLIKAVGMSSPFVGTFMNAREDVWVEEDSQEKGRVSQIANQLDILRAASSMLQEECDFLETTAANVQTSVGKKVFVVHGRNERWSQEVPRFLEQLDLDVTVLREEPNQGLTVIEKLVKHSNADFAVVLLTGDDRGGLVSDPFKQQKLRARQNVILELGFFIGKLGRERVCALYVEGVEVPSDYNGVIFILIDAPGAWKMSLIKELKAAGIPFDETKAF